jgi:DNA-binding NarL/FixJ family response regulator
MTSTSPNDETTMLIVEDQPLMRRMLKEFVQAAYPDRTILEAGDGSSGLALCYACRPRLVLMDIGLPDANGIELTTQIKARLPETDIIIVSGHTGSAYRERAREAGACAFVAKDDVHQDLLPWISRVLAGPRRDGAPRD